MIQYGQNVLHENDTWAFLSIYKLFVETWL